MASDEYYILVSRGNDEFLISYCLSDQSHAFMIDSLLDQGCSIKRLTAQEYELMSVLMSVNLWTINEKTLLDFIEELNYEAER